MASNFDCPRCGALTQYKATAVGRNSDQATYGEPVVNAWLQCTSCSYVFGGVQDAPSHTRLIDWWPRRWHSREFPDVPEQIASAATEATLCLSMGAYRGAGALARAVIEATAKDKGAQGRDLHVRIEGLYAAGHIRKHTKEQAHEIRHYGNSMAHGDFIEFVAKDEAEEIITLMTEVLDEVYQSPARLERRKAARQSQQAKS